VFAWRSLGTPREHVAARRKAEGIGAGTMSDEGTRHDFDFDFNSPLLLQRLVYLQEGDEVTIGRPETESYAIFPPDGAELVRRLADGATPAQAARWYSAEYGEDADIADVIAALDELGFTREAGQAQAEATPVRWQRLGEALFSRAAFLVYAAIAAAAAVCIVRSPALLPEPHDLIFSSYYSVIGLTLLAAAFPLITIHELAHVLAARRLGVSSRTKLSYRLYYLVVETSLDGLVVVPRRKRYLPILAGMLADCVLVSVLVLVADAARGPAEGLSLTSRVCLGIAFAAVIRVLWQFYFYMRTDVYALLVTALGCVDLYTTAKNTLANRFNRLLGRRSRLLDESAWHPADRRAARWYSWLILIGYAVSVATLFLALGPVFLEMIRGAFLRFGGGRPADLLLDADSAIFLLLTLAQVALPLGMVVRDRLRRRRSESELIHVIA
jgi:hypothetical protein